MNRAPCTTEDGEDAADRSITCPHHAGAVLRRLVLCVTSRCNSACSMCDFWDLHPPRDLTPAQVSVFFQRVPAASYRSVLLTGGEPLCHPQIEEIINCIPRDLDIDICTNGLLLPLSERIETRVSSITVSLDAAEETTYRKIRGRAGLEYIWAELASLKKRSPSVRLTGKVTVQRNNYAEIPAILSRAKRSNCIDEIGFNIVDTESAAFRPWLGADEYFTSTVDSESRGCDLLESDLEEFLLTIERIEKVHGDLLHSGFVCEGDLRRFLARFQQRLGLGRGPQRRRCCVPYHNIVVRSDWTVNGCFFLPAERIRERTFSAVLDAYARSLRCLQVLGGHPHCRSCDQLLGFGALFEH